jgi:hypothetical protein
VVWFEQVPGRRCKSGVSRAECCNLQTSSILG